MYSFARTDFGLFRNWILITQHIVVRVKNTRCKSNPICLNVCLSALLIVMANDTLTGIVLLLLFYLFIFFY
jgi:hypothetical protein